ncbi:hypothetical protein AB0J13_38550 [Streptomyces anulatus]|uniref:hypothetical protein n=1 Tax=Streptomyces anulatus TaxID=1892 RepID=UPI0033E8D41A
MSRDEFRGAQIRRAWEPPEEVVVPAPLAYSPDLQPEDYGVLLRLLLRDPELPSSVLALSKEFQESGWKMGDTRLRGVMKRLGKAGHVLRERDGYDAETGRPRWAFAVYRNPGNNPEHAASRAGSSVQVRPTRWNPTEGVSLGGSDALDSNVYAGQADTLESNASEPDTLVSDALDSNVYAGQADTLESNGTLAAPPTPPYREEEDSSSLKSSSVTGVPTGAQTTDAAAVAAAAEFLAELPGKWARGRKSAGELAPLLAEAVAAQGWELGSDLVQLLTRQVAGRRSALSALRDRIEDLPRYHRARKSLEAERVRAARAEAGQQPVPEAPVPGHASVDGQVPTGPAGEAVLPAGVSAERVEEARQLLLSLSAPWTPDSQTAVRLAPLLAAVTAERGWDLGEVLRQQLMSNPGGGQNYTWLLEHKRIATLPDRSAARKPRQLPAGACERHYWLPAIPDTPCAGCLKDERDRQREAARREEAERKAADEQTAEPGTEGPAVPGQVPADVTAFVQELAAGAVQEADAAARQGGAHLSDQERRRHAEDQERARRQESRDLAHAHSAGS